MIVRDDWLSEFFPDSVYKFIQPFTEKVNLYNGFIYTKIPAEDCFALNMLLKMDFSIIETSLFFIQKQINYDIKNKTGFFCRDAKYDDLSRIKSIAANTFYNSRFYKDLNIEKKQASIIKENWVENFFKGQRGTRMIVCESLAKDIAGFMLLINETIDLIATSSNYLGKGIASYLIGFANNDLGCLKAGTQSTNLPAIKLYNKMNFSIDKVYLTLHRH